MSKSTGFLVGKLKELFNTFNGIKIRYEFNGYMDLHLIEILPLETFESDNDFILQEIKIQDEFEKLFGKNEEILFISSDSLNKIENSEFSIGYNELEAVEISNLINRDFHFTHVLEDMMEVNNNFYALAA